jgi:hypothetical protein
MVLLNAVINMENKRKVRVQKTNQVEAEAQSGTSE